jgi:archaellin
MKEFKRSHMRKDRCGAIGIGTLIVFIAMVLVAVIAAAVIIKTASELEQSAEQYGDNAKSEAGLSIKVQQFEGQVGTAPNDDEIVNLRIYVTLFGGSESMDLRYLILHIFGTDNEGAGDGFSVDYIHPNAQNPPAGANTYAITEITDPLDSYNATNGIYVLDQQSTLRIDLNDITNDLGDGLSPLSDITIQFMLSNGGAITTESANTPGSYLEAGWYNLV